MSDTSVINLTKSQSLIHLVNAQTTYCVWARNSGKTSAGIGLPVLHLSEVMPRAQVLLYSDTFERLNDVLVPAILNAYAALVDETKFIKEKKINTELLPAV